MPRQKLFDLSSIQTDLSNIITWGAENRNDFNFEKFEQIRLQKSNKCYPSSHFLSINGEEIVLKDTVKDLGVWCSFKMSWVYHITKRLRKANMQFNFFMHLQFVLQLKTNISERKNFNDDA